MSGSGFAFFHSFRIYKPFCEVDLGFQIFSYTILYFTWLFRKSYCCCSHELHFGGLHPEVISRFWLLTSANHEGNAEVFLLKASTLTYTCIHIRIIWNLRSFYQLTIKSCVEKGRAAACCPLMVALVDC